ncbi:MAG: ERF family protein, partial [Brevibacillus sp.]|nr:ERF family protein [Brevibacillus sp.]
MMSETKSLVKKLALVMKEVKYIQKRGYNSFHKYKYATEADVAEKVREILAEQNVILIPNMTSHSVREHTTSKGNREYIVTVSMEFRFIDGDTGETITFNMTGEGQDSGDKGTYKAITGAQKYALMKAFLIPTGDDPEADEGADERNAAQKTNGKKEQEPSPALKAKWEMLAGTVDGFDEWYQKQRQNGASEKDMNN